MLKRSWVWLAGGLMLVMFWGLMVTGCGTTGGTISAVLDSVTTIGTSEATLSGSIALSGGVMDINLNAVIVSGEALTLPASSFRVKVGDSPSTITGTGTLEFTLASVTEKPLDIVFILDNTGSMSGAITGSKNSINAFAASLEALGADAKFALVTYGDSPFHPTPSEESYPTTEADPYWNDGNAHVRPIMDFGTASALRELLSTEVYAEGGSDWPENPLDAITWGYENLTWRAAAQKVFIVITDAQAHQNIPEDVSSDNKCVTSGEAVIDLVSGKAVVYSISPNYTSSQFPYLDVRRLADGLGENRTTPESNTGGKWLPFSYSFDLNDLNIDTTLTAGYTIRFNYTFSAGTYYVLLEVDTDGDGIFDSNMLITIGVTSSSVGPKAFTTFSNVKPINAKSLKADDGVERSN